MFFVSPKNTTRDQKQNAGHNLTPKTQHQNLKKIPPKHKKMTPNLCHKKSIKNKNRPKIKRLSVDQVLINKTLILIMVMFKYINFPWQYMLINQIMLK